MAMRSMRPLTANVPAGVARLPAIATSPRLCGPNRAASRRSCRTANTSSMIASRSPAPICASPAMMISAAARRSVGGRSGKRSRSAWTSRPRATAVALAGRSASAITASGSGGSGSASTREGRSGAGARGGGGAGRPSQSGMTGRPRCLGPASSGSGPVAPAPKTSGSPSSTSPAVGARAARTRPYQPSGGVLGFSIPVT